ncbi:MAG: DUF4837 family protein [Bacteroidales bacterium]|nr:DUF4837 family protein [Bacteroidales bacterium]
MMKSKIIIPLIVLCAFIVTGCKGKFNALPVATGSPYEIYVVLPEGEWNSEAGKAIKEVYTSEMVGLPQREQNFRFSFVDPQHFDNIIKPVRNIMFVEVGDIYTQPKFSFTKDVWSQGQMILYLKTPDIKSLETFIPENKDVMINFFVNTEINRRVKYLKKNFNKDASEQLADLLGVEMNIPTELVQMKKRNNFFWISNSQALRMDLVVYSVPYTEEDAFSLDKIIARRDSIMKYNIPGSVDGSYMKTSKAVDPSLRVLNFNNKYVAEVRGLWDVEGDAMGGPFVSHTRLDEVNNRIITVEAFLYSPKKAKRNNLRQLEAALYTLQLPQETELPEIPVVVTK